MKFYIILHITVEYSYLLGQLNNIESENDKFKNRTYESLLQRN